MSQPRSVLFVCTGNICRSAMAEAIMHKLLADKGIDSVHVLSAGISTVAGYPADRAAISVASQAGIDLTGHSSTPVSEQQITAADLILVMEDRHRETVLSLVPDAQSRTRLLTEYLADELGPTEVAMGIPDPMGEPVFTFRRVFMEIYNAVERVIQKHYP